MPIKNLTLGLALLLAGSALAQHQTYRVKEGDTLSGIAARFHVRTHALVKANSLDGGMRLKIGHELTIPSATTSSDCSASHSVPSGYVVRNGDVDWTIAHKAGLTVHQLHVLNPGVNWMRIHPGQSLNVPGAKSVAVREEKPAKAAPSTGYTVRDGDNDWVIAHRVGVTTVVLRRMNPGVNLARLRPGQTINVPKSAAEKVVAARIRTRYARVSGDAVTIRDEASRSSDALGKVEAGTLAKVLDRDGDWYRLRFPYGTEGWVRGDLLEQASAPVVAKVHHKRHPRQETIVAEAPHKSRRHMRHLMAKHSASARHEMTESFSEAMEASSEAEGGETQERLLKKAESMRGTRYRWGAMSRSATDCSGFTSQVFKSQGYKIPRTSREQAKVGQTVHYKDLKKGDLVFFHTVRGSRVSHVGIYMGDGKFIHASSGGGKVQVNSLSDGYYHKRLVGAKRIAKVAPKKKSSSASDRANDPVDTAPAQNAPDESGN